MNFKFAFVGTSLLAFAGILLVGCGRNECEQAFDTVVERLSSCPDFGDIDNPSPSLECPGVSAGGVLSGAESTCQASCWVASSCECLGFDKTKTCAASDSEKFIDCVDKCAGSTL